MTRALHSLLFRLSHIEQVCGTLTERLQIDEAALIALEACEVWPEDLTLFKRIVERGIMKSARFRSPMGYKVLDFLTYLKHMQEERREKAWQAERDEMNRLYLTMPAESKAAFKAWMKRPHVEISFSQTVQLTFNAWIDGYKVGDTVTDSKSGEQVEIVAIDRSVGPSKALTVKGGEQNYILHPMNIAV